MSKKTKQKPKKGSDLSYLLSENLNKEQKEKLNQIKNETSKEIKKQGKTLDTNILNYCIEKVN